MKTLRDGERAGYGLEYAAHGERTIAVLSIGYADGLPRDLSCGRGHVLLHGRKAPIVGRVCMDQTLVDVTDIPEARRGDAAVVVGRSGEQEIAAYDLSEAGNTITNEWLSRLGRPAAQDCGVAPHVSIDFLRAVCYNVDVQSAGMAHKRKATEG